MLAASGVSMPTPGHRLSVSPPKELSLGQAIELLKREAEPRVRVAAVEVAGIGRRPAEMVRDFVQ